MALDVASARAALRFADRLGGLTWAKVGPALYLQDGPALVRELIERGIRVFLDLKWHDIPTTVAGAVGAAARLGVELATVHAGGGRAMLRAAVAAGTGIRIAGVTVLTSHDAQSYGDVIGRRGLQVEEEVTRLARLAAECGVGALVASPREARQVRTVVGADCWIVTPGIRLPGAPADDQRRTATPAEAVAAGATHLVVGRPIVCADEPRAVYEELCHAAATQVSS